MLIKDSEDTMIKNLEASECGALLSENYIGRLAFVVVRDPYISPITYFYDADNKSILSYSAPRYKIDAMKRHRSIAFQVDDIQSIHSSGDSCSFMIALNSWKVALKNTFTSFLKGRSEPLQKMKMDH